MKDPYEHIHNCTNERLAEILEANARFERFILENNYEQVNATPPEDVLPPILWVKAVMEAARRLRNIQRILDAKVPFNSEQFNV